MTDMEIRDAISSGAIAIGPLGDEQLQPASYDLRLGDRAIVTKSVDIEKLRERVESEPVPEINVARESSLTIPAGAFALVVTKERVRLSAEYAGHLGLRSYFARKGSCSWPAFRSIPASTAISSSGSRISRRGPFTS